MFAIIDETPGREGWFPALLTKDTGLHGPDSNSSTRLFPNGNRFAVPPDPTPSDGRPRAFVMLRARFSCMWMLGYGFPEDRSPTHGYEATREAAMAAFAKSWRRE
jgi:hypothetical protein